MWPEANAMELVHRKLKGEVNPKLKEDISKFLKRAERELTSKEYEKFRKQLSQVLAKEETVELLPARFLDLFSNYTGLKVDFNKFVGDENKILFVTDEQRLEAAALGAYNVGELPSQQSSSPAGPSGSSEIPTESSTEVSSLSADEMPESAASPTSFAGIVQDQSPK